MDNPFYKNEFFATPDNEELEEIIARCKNPSEATMIAAMVWNMAHELFDEEWSMYEMFKKDA